MPHHWNYRVIEFHAPDDDAYRAIHEVHYDVTNRPVAYAAEAADIFWLTAEGDQAAYEILAHMRRALEKPILHDYDFPMPHDHDGQ